MTAGRDSRCSGFVVAGGRSRRMGRDKALLAWRSGTLLDAAVERLGRVAADVTILCGAPGRYAGRAEPCVADDVPDSGALGGVYTGLTALRRPLGLFLAVDLPFVPEGLLRHLVASAVDVDAVVPFSPRGAEPLCAVYARACRDPIRRRLEAGERRMSCFWPDVRVRRVEPAELERFGDPERLFRNLNTAEDYAAATHSRARSSSPRSK